MSFTKFIVVLLIYSISFIIFYFLGEKIKFRKWISQNNKSEFNALSVAVLLYIIGYVIMDKFYISATYYYILNGILIAVPMIILYYVVPSVLKNMEN